MSYIMQAVILAAGLGNRLGNLTDDRPKAMVRINGKELILYVLDFLNHPAVTERIVVTGFGSELLGNFLKQHRPDVRTVFNKHFTEGSVCTIETALPHLMGDVLILNADHIYPRRLLTRVIECRRGITAVCDFDRVLVDDDMKVKCSPDGRLLHIRKTLSDYDGGYIGMTFCSSEMLDKYRNAVETTKVSDGNGAPVEFVLGRLAASALVHICDTSGIRWLEIDTPEDILHAEVSLFRQEDFLL